MILAIATKQKEDPAFAGLLCFGQYTNLKKGDSTYNKTRKALS